ncbi:MAG: cytochrome c oxidase subunit 3 [Acidobacteriota bacterium]|nr:cytochrome c oxidase subunit 3 [Acidobacteriota bacterium]
MPGTLSPSRTGEGGRPPVELPPPGGGDGQSNNSEEHGARRKTSLIGLAVMMTASLITFGALAFALIVRRQLSHDWVKMPLPWILWPNTAVLLTSSIFLDAARRLLRSHRVAFNWFWTVGTVLGAGFLFGQIAAWRQLNRAGLFVAGNPSNGFFYILTWTHAAHAVVGLGALLWVAQAALRFKLGPARRTFVDVSVVFWHFLDVLWIGLMLLLIYRG